MGMYTEIYVNTDLKKETPQEVIDVLSAMCDKNNEADCLKDKPSRWAYLFSNGSYYLPLTECGKLTHDSIAGTYSLLAKGDIKDYKNEIEEFFEFIKPWCDGEYIGYYRYEESREPTLVYADPNEQSNKELTGEYHADCNKLIKDLANEQSKIERIRAEIESLPYRKFDVDHPDQLITKARCLEIIDRISNESDITDNGGDS